MVTIDQTSGHAYTLFEFNHRSHEGNVGGKYRVQGLVGDGPGKKRTLASAALPRKFRLATLRAHITRQVAEGAAIAATLEIEMAILAPIPEFLFDRILRARFRLGRSLLRLEAHFRRQFVLVAHVNLLRIAILPSPRSPQPVTRPVWASAT